MSHFSRKLKNKITNKLNSNGSRITAAILGSLITTVALTVCITLVWPFGDLIEQIFAGGTFFFVFWASLFYWAILAEGGKKAWLRILALFFPVLAIDIISLTFK